MATALHEIDVRFRRWRANLAYRHIPGLRCFSYLSRIPFGLAGNKLDSLFKSFFWWYLMVTFSSFRDVIDLRYLAQLEILLICLLVGKCMFEILPLWSFIALTWRCFYPAQIALCI